MKLIYPEKFTMNVNTLIQNKEYCFGSSTGNIYFAIGGFMIGDLIESIPDRWDSSLWNLLYGKTK
jgi:hypothetical protein